MPCLSFRKRLKNLSFAHPNGDLRQQPVDPRRQRRHEMGAITARRIDLALPHGERE
jgi:hypothetical protein